MRKHQIILWFWLIVASVLFTWAMILLYDRTHELPDIQNLPTPSASVAPSSTPLPTLAPTPVPQQAVAPRANMNSTYIPPVTMPVYQKPDFGTPIPAATIRPYVPASPPPLTGPTPDPCHIGWGC